MKKPKKFLSLEEFGTAIGLTPLDKELIRQKNKIIERLKMARLKRNLSQTALANKMGTKQPAIARMEAGMVGEVSFDFLVRIALALGVTLKISPAHRRKAA